MVNPALVILLWAKMPIFRLVTVGFVVWQLSGAAYFSRECGVLGKLSKEEDAPFLCPPPQLWVSPLNMKEGSVFAGTQL